MNLILTMKQTKYIASSISLSFLCIHLAMLALFNWCGVVPMARFNVFSILFYLATFLLIHKGQFRAYVVLVYVEVILHMTLAVVFVGWNAGFQITLIGMCLLAFFSEYLGRALSIHHISGLGLSLMGMCAYLFSLEYVYYHPSPYHLPADVEFWLQIAWGIIVFAIDVFFLQVFVIVTFESEKLMSKQLSHDKLTGLPNRYYMSDYLAKLESEGTLQGHWIAMIDIDDFKRVNDRYGHNCGDYVLREVAGLLDANKGTGVLCRWGGEEFLLVGEVAEDDAASYECLQHLRRAIGKYRFWYDNHRLELTITVGAAPFQAEQSITEWISAADKMLYAGKSSGKNRVVIAE